MSKNDEGDRRQCLRCKIYFDSEWPGNRICPKCSKKNAKLSMGLPAYDIDGAGVALPDDDQEPLPLGTSSTMQSSSSQAVES